MICILCAVDAGCGRQKRHGAEISFYALRKNILSLHCIYVFTSHSFWFHKYYSLLLSILFIFLFRTVNACLNRIWRIVRDGLPFRCKQQKPRLRVRKLELHFFCSLVWLIPFWKARMQKKTYLIAAFDSVESFDFLIPFFQFNCVKETYRRKFCCILFFHLRIFAVECSNQNLKAIGKNCIFSVEEAIFRVNGNMNWTLIRERDGNNSMLNICKWDKISSVWWQWNEYVWENIVVLTRLRLAYTSYACVPYPIKYHYIILYHCIRLV